MEVCVYGFVSRGLGSRFDWGTGLQNNSTFDTHGVSLLGLKVVDPTLGVTTVTKTDTRSLEYSSYI